MPTFIPIPFASALDVVGIFNNSFQQVLINARPIDVDVLPRSKVMDHTIETGQVLSDYRILLPIAINYRVIIPSPFFRDTYQEIKNLYQAAEVLTVQTKTDNYPQMIIAEMPHRETPEIFDGIPLTLQLRQAQLIPSLTTFAPLDPTNTNTQELGEQSPYPVTGIQTVAPVQLSNNIIIPAGENLFSSIPPQQPSYTLEGVQTSSGVATIFAAQPTAAVQVLGVQSTIPQTTISSGFN